MLRSCFSNLFGRSVFAIYISTVTLLAFNTNQKIEAAQEPSTVAQAQSVLDLSQFPLVGDEPRINYREIAGQNYTSKGGVIAVAKEIQKLLKAQQWQEDGDAIITESYASATMQRDGYVLSLSVMPGPEPESATVTIQNHSNVRLDNLPRPDGCETLYATSVVAAYRTDLSVEQTAAECRKRFLDAGWQEHGNTTVGFFVKQNATRVQAFISAAPAQDDKTVIQFSAALMSVDLPCPLDAENSQYSDSTKSLFFESRQSQNDVIDFYKKALAKEGWKTTTDEPFKIDFFDHLIFRQPNLDLIEMEFKNVAGKTQTTVVFQTAAQVKEIERLAKAAILKKKAADDATDKMEAAKTKTFSCPTPAGAKITDESEQRIVYGLAMGKAKSVVAAWLKSIDGNGWRSTTNVNESVVGNFTLINGESEVHVTFTDTGFGDASIEISAFSKTKLKAEK